MISPDFPATAGKYPLHPLSYVRVRARGRTGIPAPLQDAGGGEEDELEGRVREGRALDAVHRGHHRLARVRAWESSRRKREPLHITTVNVLKTFSLAICSP